MEDPRAARRQTPRRRANARCHALSPDPEFSAARARIRAWLIRRIIRRDLLMHRAELLHIADIGLHLAARAYRPERGPLLPLAWRYVKRETLAWLHAERRHSALRRTLEAEAPMAPDAPLAHLCLDLPRVVPAPLDRELAIRHGVEGLTLRELGVEYQTSFRQVRARVLQTHEALATYFGNPEPDAG